MKNGDMPAMPITDEMGSPFNSVPRNLCSIGLTKREYFAGLAMQGLLASDVNESLHQNDCVHIAVSHADALLAELEK